MHALGLRGLLRDDVDDAVHGVRAPDRAAGSADDLDPLDVLDREVLLGPDDSAEERACRGCGRRSSRAACSRTPGGSHESRSPSGSRRSAPPGAPGPSRSASGTLVKPPRRRSSAVITVIGRGGELLALGLLRDRGHFDVHQGFEGEIEQVVRCARRPRGEHEQADQDQPLVRTPGSTRLRISRPIDPPRPWRRYARGARRTQVRRSRSSVCESGDLRRQGMPRPTNGRESSNPVETGGEGPVRWNQARWLETETTSPVM